MLVGYARVSTAEQNLDLQIDALTQAGCESIYQEKLSGATTKRPALQAMLNRLDPGDVLVVWKLDRLGRNLRDLVLMVDKLRERQVDLKVLTQGIDTTNPMGRFLFGLFAVLAELERDMTVERTKAGLEARRRQGSIIGRPAKVTDEMRARALELVASGEATNATELMGLLGLKKPTFTSAFKGGFAELKRVADGLRETK